jgi:hypothetical protein
MMDNARLTRQRVVDAAREHENAKAAVERMERDCEHNHNPSLFTPAKYDPIIHPAGYSAGDPPGTMGIDRQLPCSWPGRREDRWTRECTRCGKVEHTQQSRDLPVKKEPVFNRW